MIAVISDSHIPMRENEIPEQFHEKLSQADFRVHCGDVETEKVLEELEERHGKFYAVKGNMDRFELPASETFEVDDVRFGAYHGTGIHPRGDHDTLVETAKKLDAKVLFTGHTHEQEAFEQDGKVILNPGSCTGAGGGSASGGNPEMLTAELEDGELLVKMMEIENDNLIEEEKRFKV